LTDLAPLTDTSWIAGRQRLATVRRLEAQVSNWPGCRQRTPYALPFEYGEHTSNNLKSSSMMRNDLNSKLDMGLRLWYNGGKTDRSVLVARRRAFRLNHCRTQTAQPRTGTTLGSNHGHGLDDGEPATCVRWSLGIHQGGNGDARPSSSDGTDPPWSRCG
jgi:hypothetical protein